MNWDKVGDIVMKVLEAIIIIWIFVFSGTCFLSGITLGILLGFETLSWLGVV